MARVLGIGGVFFKCRDPKALGEWYRERLGLDLQDFGGVAFRNADAPPDGVAIWSTFPDDTTYFDPSEKPFMINLMVDDLDAMLASLRDAGVEVDAHIEESEFGRFGWFMDPERNRVELWQPPT